MNTLLKRLPYPEPEQWKPKIEVYLSCDEEPDRDLEVLDGRIRPYILQLQWLLEHYPEQDGRWSEDNRWFIYFDDEREEWDISADYSSPTLNLIFMSLEAARHLRNDLRSGKVWF